VDANFTTKVFDRHRYGEWAAAGETHQESPILANWPVTPGDNRRWPRS